MDHHRDHDHTDERKPGEDLDTRHPADRARDQVEAEMEAHGESLEDWSPDDDRRYREDYEKSPHRLDDRDYEQVRPVYQFGHRAASHPEWRGRNFDEIEADLQKQWGEEHRQRHGEWTRVRPHVRSAYTARTSGLAHGPRTVGAHGALRSDKV